MPWFEKFIYGLVVYSVGMFFVESELGGANSLAGPALFLWSERLVASILTVEVCLRFLFCSSITKRGTDQRYFRSPEMVFDLIAVVPFWLGFIVEPEWLAAVRSMRILRLLKFYRASPVAHQVMHNLIAQRKKIRLVINFVAIIVLFAGTIVQQLEPETFGSLWGSVWWAVVTVTTVGYGDMYPTTQAAQTLAMCLMAIGVGFCGALFSIVATAFDVDLEVE